MQYITRRITTSLQKRLQSNPAVALLGPRQCGKSTLAKKIQSLYPQSVYLDLEMPSDIRKINEPELFFSHFRNNLICLDEIQRAPELFRILRGVIDNNQRNGQFLILGSASRDLIRQSSETLAGRISYLELSPFLWAELQHLPEISLSKYWMCGGYPRSVLADEETESFIWRNDFIRSFVERDILQIKPGISSYSVNRLLQMIAHVQGQTVNYSRLGTSLNMSDNTVRHYIELLDGSFIARILPPFYSNLKKRLIKSPKVYLRDPGLLHALLGIETYDTLLGHPAAGPSWETLAIENILNAVHEGIDVSFYRTATGDEMDLVLTTGSKKVCIECKLSTAPEITKSMRTALHDLEPAHTWIIAPVDATYPLSPDITVTSVTGILDEPFFREFIR